MPTKKERTRRDRKTFSSSSSVNPRQLILLKNAFREDGAKLLKGGISLCLSTSDAPRRSKAIQMEIFVVAAGCYYWHSLLLLLLPLKSSSHSGPPVNFSAVLTDDG
jgi:hypothetical protein